MSGCLAGVQKWQIFSKYESTAVIMYTFTIVAAPRFTHLYVHSYRINKLGGLREPYLPTIVVQLLQILLLSLVHYELLRIITARVTFTAVFRQTREWGLLIKNVYDFREVFSFEQTEEESDQISSNLK